MTNYLNSISKKVPLKARLHYAIFGAVFLFLPVTIADTMTLSPAAGHITQEHTDRIPALDDAKYNRIAMLAGEEREALAKKRNHAIDTYKKWLKLQASVTASSPPSKHRLLKRAAEAYTLANLEFVNLQKEILVRNGLVSDDVVLSDVVNALNAAAPSAASKPSK